MWLPLYPKHEGKTHNFMSKRIMLPFRVDIYPLGRQTTKLEYPMQNSFTSWTWRNLNFWKIKTMVNVVLIYFAEITLVNYFNVWLILIMFITISAVLFEDAVILGAASDGVTYKPPSEDIKKSVQNLPFCIVERTVSCLTVI